MWRSIMVKKITLTLEVEEKETAPSNKEEVEHDNVLETLPDEFFVRDIERRKKEPF